MAENQSVKLTYGKAAMQFIGADSVHVLLFILVVGCTGLVIWLNDSSYKVVIQGMTTIQINQGEIIKLLREGQKAQERTSIIQTYVLSLPQSERDKLRLVEPLELRSYR